MKKLLVFLLAIFMSVSIAAKTGPIKELGKDKVHVSLSKENTLILNTYFYGNSVSQIMNKARKMDAALPSGYPIFLSIYSGGGSISAGIQLQEYLNQLNRPVHTITIFAASMGFQTVQFLGNRYILKFGQLMSHKAWGGFYGEFGGGPSQLDARYGHWLQRIDMMDKQTVKRTKGKQTLKSYRAAYENELWLNGINAVKQGYAGAVATVSCDATMKGTWTRTDKWYWNGLQIKFVDTFADCPTISSPLKMQILIELPDGEVIEYYTTETVEEQDSKVKVEKKTEKKDEDEGYSGYGRYSSYSSDESSKKLLKQPELIKLIKTKFNKHKNEVTEPQNNIKFSW